MHMRAIVHGLLYPLMQKQSIMVIWEPWPNACSVKKPSMYAFFEFESIPNMGSMVNKGGGDM